MVRVRGDSLPKQCYERTTKNPVDVMVNIGILATDSRILERDISRRYIYRTSVHGYDVNRELRGRLPTVARGPQAGAKQGDAAGASSRVTLFCCHKCQQHIGSYGR